MFNCGTPSIINPLTGKITESPNAVRRFEDLTDSDIALSNQILANSIPYVNAMTDVEANEEDEVEEENEEEADETDEADEANKVELVNQNNVDAINKMYERHRMAISVKVNNQEKPNISADDKFWQDIATLNWHSEDEMRRGHVNKKLSEIMDETSREEFMVSYKKFFDAMMNVANMYVDADLIEKTKVVSYIISRGKVVYTNVLADGVFLTITYDDGVYGDFDFFLNLV